MTPQEQLANVLREHLLPLFKLRRPECDPWWWPIGIGAKTQDWFGPIQQSEMTSATGLSLDDLTSSLKRSGGTKSPHLYAAFRGFWGHATVEGRIVAVVSHRPSLASYPQGPVTTMMRVMNGAGYHGAHMTDFIKRRGPQGSMELPDGESLKDHANILVQELVAVAETGPEPLHIVPLGYWGLTEQHDILRRVRSRLNKPVSGPKDAACFPYYPNTMPYAAKVASWQAALIPHLIL